MNRTAALDSIRVRAIDAEQLPETDLQRALLEARVKILDEDDVRTYQAAKLEEVRAQRNKAARRSIPLHPLALGWLTGSCCGWTAEFLHAGWLVVSAVSMLGGLLAFFLIGLVRDRKGASTLMLAWRRYSVGACGGVLEYLTPSFRVAGAKARTVIPAEGIAIFRRLAETGVTAKLMVEQLDDDPFLIAQADDDPFLIAQASGEHYYLFAWDEEGFTPR